MTQMEQTITVKLPQPLVRRLQRAAELTFRSVDDVLASTVGAALSAPPDLPDDLADELAAMHLLNDEALQAAAQPSLSAAEQQQLRQLNQTAAERSLIPAEADRAGRAVGGVPALGTEKGAGAGSVGATRIPCAGSAARRRVAVCQAHAYHRRCGRNYASRPDTVVNIARRPNGWWGWSMKSIILCHGQRVGRALQTTSAWRALPATAINMPKRMALIRNLALRRRCSTPASRIGSSISPGMTRERGLSASLPLAAPRSKSCKSITH